MPTCFINTNQDLSEIAFGEYASLTFAVNPTTYPISMTKSHSPSSAEAKVSPDLPSFTNPPKSHNDDCYILTLTEESGWILSKSSYMMEN